MHLKHANTSTLNLGKRNLHKHSNSRGEHQRQLEQEQETGTRGTTNHKGQHKGQAGQGHARNTAEPTDSTRTTELLRTEHSRHPTLLIAPRTIRIVASFLFSSESTFDAIPILALHSSTYGAYTAHDHPFASIYPHSHSHLPPFSPLTPPPVPPMGYTADLQIYQLVRPATGLRRGTS